jgi:SulP family sulfate permease
MTRVEPARVTAFLVVPPLMHAPLTSPVPSDRPAFVELFTPKLVTVLREGYTAAHLRADIVAALTVAIVALPLSMAIAIASGATPAQGL